MDVDDPDPGAGFTEAFDCYAPDILRFARRRTSSRDSAWDVVSDTFTIAWRHWDRRPAPDRLLPWLYAIAGNSVRDQHRSSERRRRLLVRLSADRPGAAADHADGVVLGDSISTALARLPAADQEILRLIAWEGQTDACALGIALGLRPAASAAGCTAPAGDFAPCWMRAMSRHRARRAFRLAPKPAKER